MSDDPNKQTASDSQNGRADGRTPGARGHQGTGLRVAGAQGQSPGDAGAQARSPGDVGAQGQSPGDVGAQGQSPGDVGAQGQSPRDVGAQAQSPRDAGEGRLASLIDQLARNQPLRRAPGSLEHRVLAQLALHQTTETAWQKGFAHWPLAARAAFLVASIGIAWLTFTGFLSAMSLLGSGEVAGTAISWVRVSTEVASVIISAGSFVLHAIPPAWLYATAAAGFVLYAMLFGLGTVAYRTLYVER